MKNIKVDYLHFALFHTMFNTYISLNKGFSVT